MIKQIAVIGLLLLISGVANAGEVVTIDNSRIDIYDAIETTVFMSSVNDNKTNYNRTMCINATCIEGEISITGTDDYELEYNFIADINESVYVSRILVIKQETIASGLLTGITIRRNLTLDGVLIGTYITKPSFWGKTKKNTVYWNLIDRNIRFGKDIVANESLTFTQLNYVDQQDYLPIVTKNLPKFPISHKYITVNENGDPTATISGLTGVIYNVLEKIPFVGKSIQSAIYLPLTIIQFIFNIIFTFIVLISNNWYYALMLIEIFCIMPSLKYKRFSDRVGTYISTHVKIYNFMYHAVILPTINLILRLIEIIRNMFRI